jgi:hypothetical protein
VVQAPAGDGRRLVPDDVDGVAFPPTVPGNAPNRSTTSDEVTPKSFAKADREIRLTYRELSALIEDAIRSLR